MGIYLILDRKVLVCMDTMTIRFTVLNTQPIQLIFLRVSQPTEKEKFFNTFASKSDKLETEGLYKKMYA